MASQLKALVVDDSDLSRLMMTTSLDSVFVCDEAENGLLAVQKYQKAIIGSTPYDIVFMDIVMPEMDGKEALRKIREFEQRSNTPRVPVYMVSASEMLDGIEGLADGLLRKPASKVLLQEICQKHFQERM